MRGGEAMAKKRRTSEGGVGNADDQRTLAASAVVAVGSADAEKERARPVRGAAPPRAVYKDSVEEANEKEQETAPKAALAAPTSQHKKSRASRGGREAPGSVRARKDKTLPSTDEVAYEGFETLDQRGKKAKRSATKADLASSDPRKLRRASEAAARPVDRADRAEHAHDGAHARADENRAFRLAEAPVPSSPLVDAGSGSSLLAEAPNRGIRFCQKKTFPFCIT